LQIDKLGIKLKDRSSEHLQDYKKTELHPEVPIFPQCSKDDDESKFSETYSKERGEKDVPEKHKKTGCEEKVVFPIEYSKDEVKKDILKRLQIIKSVDDVEPSSCNVDYDVFKCCEKSSFKKSTVQLPDFRIIVIS